MSPWCARHPRVVGNLASEAVICRVSGLGYRNQRPSETDEILSCAPVAGERPGRPRVVAGRRGRGRLVGGSMISAVAVRIHMDYDYSGLRPVRPLARPAAAIAPYILLETFASPWCWWASAHRGDISQSSTPRSVKSRCRDRYGPSRCRGSAKIRCPRARVVGPTLPQAVRGGVWASYIVGGCERSNMLPNW